MTFKGRFTTSVPSTSTITRTNTIFFFFFDSHRNFSKKKKIRNKRSSHLYKFVHCCLQTVTKQIRKYSRLRNWRSFAQKRGNVEYSKGNFAGDFSARSASSPIVPGNSLTLSPYRFSSRAVNVNPGQLYYWVIIPGKPWGSTRAKKKNEEEEKRGRPFGGWKTSCRSESVRANSRHRINFARVNRLEKEWWIEEDFFFNLQFSCLFLEITLFSSYSGGYIILFYYIILLNRIILNHLVFSVVSNVLSFFNEFVHIDIILGNWITILTGFTRMYIMKGFGKK